MRVFHLEHQDYVDYDEFEGFVVHARDEEQARRVAYDYTSKDSDSNIADFLDPNKVVCRELPIDEPEPHVVLASYKAG